MATPFRLPVVPFSSAVDSAEARVSMLPEAFYQDAMIESRRLAFTVSNMTKLAQIGGVLDSLNDSLRRGDSFRTWRETIDFDEFESLPAYRKELIFRNHVQNAYNSGTMARYEETADDRPFLMFSAINDQRTSEICRANAGLIRRADDPWWNTHTPPMHHNCRSTTISLSLREALRRGGESASEGLPAAEGFGLRDEFHERAILELERDLVREAQAAGAQLARVTDVAEQQMRVLETAYGKESARRLVASVRITPPGLSDAEVGAVQAMRTPSLRVRLNWALSGEGKAPQGDRAQFAAEGAAALAVAGASKLPATEREGMRAPRDSVRWTRAGDTWLVRGLLVASTAELAGSDVVEVRGPLRDLSMLRADGIAEGVALPGERYQVEDETEEGVILRRATE